MKTNKIILSMAIAIAILLAALSACSEPGGDDTSAEQSSGDDTSAEQSYLDEYVLSRSPAPLTIWINENTDFKSEIIERIDVLRVPGENDDGHSIPSAYNLAALEEFYSPSKINGFRLFTVSVNEHGFVYHFAPGEKSAGDEEYSFSNDNGIEIVIERPGLMLLTHFDGDAAEYLKAIARENLFMLTDDGFVIGGNHIFGQIGNTTFRATISGSLRNYGKLRDLAFVIINTFELVNVQAELDILRQSRAPLSLPAPLVIRGIENGEYRKAIIDEIHTSLLMTEEQRGGSGNYGVNRISDIKEFYYPGLDGYELYSVAIFDGVFIFRFVPVRAGGIIEIAVRRQEWYDAQGIYDQFNAEVRQAQTEGWGYLTEDGMLYSEEDGNIVARIGGTSVRIDVPRSMNNYETLRDLAFQVIRTAELVNVQAELDILRQNRD